MHGASSRHGFRACVQRAAVRLSPVRLSCAGVLVSIDGYMNVAMEQTEEYVDGQLQNQYGDAFIRGNNVLYISASKEATAALPPEAAAQ